MNPTAAQSLLKQLSAVPTAPFHEDRVAAFIKAFLSHLGCAVQTDLYGNVITSINATDGGAPSIALVAHMDHPGFEITAAQGEDLTAETLGDVRAIFDHQPVAVLLVDGAETIRGTVLDSTPALDDPRRLRLTIRAERAVSVGAFGFLALPLHEQNGMTVRLRVADDLAGCAVILATLSAITERGSPGPVYGVFTRAEEVGLVGAMLVAEQRQLPPETVVVSVECSRALPGAEQGNGPVIRVGDGARAFHPEGEALLLAAKERLASASPPVAVQRQLMSGGTCEATAFGVAGYRTAGVALPLANYHNVGPDGNPAPEQIDLRDYLGAIDLLTSAVQLAGQPAELAIERRLAARLRQYRDRLALRPSSRL